MALNVEALRKLFDGASAAMLRDAADHPNVKARMNLKRAYPDGRVMAAIAMAESSGDPTVINSIGATGLWQVFWKVWAGDVYISWLTGGNQHRLTDPVTNGKAATYIYYVQGYEAWDTYKNGAYKKFLDPGYQGPNLLPVPTGVVTGTIDGATATITAAQSIGGWVGQLTETLRKLSLDAGGFIFGVLLVILGVVILIHKDAEKVVKTVSGVVK